MNAPTHPELRLYLLQLVSEERSLEALYKCSHSERELAEIRAQWKAASRSIKKALVAEELRLAGLSRMHADLRCSTVAASSLKA